MALREVNVELMLCGDVMLGRGIDQILPHPGDPALHESYMGSAEGYVALAERASGPIPSPVGFPYVWGDALEAMAQRQPDARIINLETAVSRRGEPEPKGINYRMTPENLPAVTAAGIDCCVLANNHVLDWGPQALIDTVEAVADAGMRSCGAGRDDARARMPAVLPLPQRRRVVVHAFASATSGVPAHWAAGARHPGVNLLPDLSDDRAERLVCDIRAIRRPGDVTIVSLHWGGNWGYEVPERQQRFARALVRAGGVDIVHGHSSHHPKGIEIHGGRLILYGCGDLLNDYEGIHGHEAYRGDLTLLYFAGLAADGTVTRLDMVPFRIRRFRLERAGEAERAWLQQTMDRECRAFGGAVVLGGDGVLSLAVA